VNNLALSGAWLNVVSLVSFIALGLIFSLTIKYSQIILTEYLQREFYFLEINKWTKDQSQKKKKYFIEIFSGMKMLSKSFTTLLEIALAILFGLMLLIVFHPFYLLFPILIAIVIAIIIKQSSGAIEASIRISDQKFELYSNVLDEKSITTESIENYLHSREKRFKFIKFNSISIFAFNIIAQILLLGGGIILIKNQQLSLGQLVSSEIIMANMLAAFNKLPFALESLYDFETSLYKINQTKE
jgi:ABC-type bacteriocin/lantibiotic exporter with double-glycine peptidase domain